MARAVDENHQHCPFLNRADQRCSPHFHLDDLEHALEHCFGHYKMCPHYLELLVERRVRRLMAAAATAAAAHHPGAGTDGRVADDDSEPRDRDEAAAPGRSPRSPGVYVQLRVPRSPRSAAPFGATAGAAIAA